MQLLVSLGRVVMRKPWKAVRPLAAWVPGGNALLEIAHDTWEDYKRSVAQGPAPDVPDTGEPAPPMAVPVHVEIDLRNELESLARDTPAAVRQKVEQVAEQVAGDESPEVRQALANYLAQVPAMLRRNLRRPSDPTGTTLPGNLQLRKGEDLVALLPPRPPRFKSGDQPLPGVPWVLDDLLGVGGFGEVWKAHHADDKRLLVALKFCLDEEAAKTLRNEFGLVVQVMEQGRHEGIIQLRNAYNMRKGDAGTPCLEYEYVPGGDLAGLIQELHSTGRPSADMAGRIVRRLAAIIGTVHQQQLPIVHRDLKPANILVQKTSAGKLQFKIADFGIGQVTAGEAILTSTRGGDNRAGLLITRLQGSYTPLYASPQQVRGDKPDPRDDVFSFGVIWYQLLTGDLGSGAPSGMRWSKDLALAGMPQNQIDLLASCFESNPAHRPANAALLAEQLSGLLGESAPPPPVEPAPKKPPPLPQPARSSSEPIQAVLVENEEDRQVSRPPRLEDHPRFPVAEEARRKGDAAALWFLFAGIGNLAIMASHLALLLSSLFSGPRLPLVAILANVLVSMALPGAAGVLQFLASGGLKICRGKAKVIAAIVYGFVIALLCVFGAIGLGIGMTDSHTPKAILFLFFLVCLATGVANFWAAIRGILVLKDPAIGQQFGRPANQGQEPRPIFSKKLLIGLPCGLAGWFLLVFVLNLVSGR